MLCQQLTAARCHLLCPCAACNMICCYADELKEGFYPYVEQVRWWGAVWHADKLTG